MKTGLSECISENGLSAQGEEQPGKNLGRLDRKGLKTGGKETWGRV